MSNPITTQYNINLETVENCNLLCKLILDYLDTDKCVIERETNHSFRIVYPEGSFINYRDTSYELTYAYFFYPSRHSIDGQKYDLEVNIYHGKFSNNDKGMVAHSHYHNDTKNSNLHKHFHYHLKDDNRHDVHQNSINHTDKNIVTCLLFNKGKHNGSDINIFFNQFVHHPEFKKMANSTSPEKTINVHDHWTIEQIYPKKRSFFIYDEGINTYVVFDTVQTISKELIDRLFKRGIKGSSNYDISSGASFSITNPSRVMYRKNIEVITDPAYKRSKRAQIKDLLSLTRMSSYKPSERTSKEYHDFAKYIIDSYTNGSNVGFYENEMKAKNISKKWDEYGEDKPKELKLSSDVNNNNGKDIIINSEIANRYKYTLGITNFKPSGIAFSNSYPNYFDPNNFEHYLKARKSLSYLFETFLTWIKTPEVPEVPSPFGGVITERVPPVPALPAEVGLTGRKRISIFDNTIENNIFSLIKDSTKLGTENFPYESSTSFPITKKFTEATTGSTTFKHQSDGAKTTNNEATDNATLWANIRTANGLTDTGKYNKYLENVYNCRFLLYQLTSETNIQYKKALQLRVFFEEIDLEWQKKYKCESKIYSKLKEFYAVKSGLEPGVQIPTNYNNDNTLAYLHTTNVIINDNNFTIPTDFIFLTRGENLNRTLSNEECQNWLSNEIHHEGELWKFWEKTRKIGKTESFIWNQLSYIEKEKIRDGLLRFDTSDSKWKTHNNCRNPGNRGAAPWCYTKNPNKRWEYCQKPDYSDMLGKIVLFFVFILLGVIAYFTIKTLFLHEYPMKFVAKITGGTMASQETFQSPTSNTPTPPQ